ncbi:LacI family DNA-binding transcriptional regulator [Bacillaceae bacterium Marseille-Q3522]|nr:LacI family DNA-binding transcriptional regulator [Bacillaceae bacterium Marseille-Q3522]
MAVTIKDVAKLANVAPSTVSRVIANSPRISERTKRRVREAMKELDYHPNFIARSLANQSTQAIGLVMPSFRGTVFQNPFFSVVLQGLSEGAHQKQYTLSMTTGKTDEEIYDGVVRMVQGGTVDGVILLYAKIEDKVLSYLQNQQTPFVVIGKPYINVEDITHVDNNNFRAMKEATEYLIQLGHERIAFVGGNVHFTVTVERLLGYEKALREAGLPYYEEYIVHNEFLQEGGQKAIKGLLSLHHPPTALVVADDFMALGILKTLDELGIIVPEMMSIISFNNVLYTEMSRPPLTSVDINIFDLGFEAAKHLIQKLENPKEPVKRIIIPHKIVERASCSRYKSGKDFM